ncbi:MAG: hypothetical protein AAGU06_03675 [Candidatus Shapirobacteria bacterium]
MEITFQNLEWAVPTIQKMAQKNSGLTTIFRRIRKNKKYSFFGDIVLLLCISSILADESKRPKTRSEISYALRKIEEYKQMPKKAKMELLDQFYGVFLATEKDKKSPVNNKKEVKKY